MQTVNSRRYRSKCCIPRIIFFFLQTLSITTTLFVLLFERQVSSLTVTVLRQGLPRWV